MDCGSTKIRSDGELEIIKTHINQARRAESFCSSTNHIKFQKPHPTGNLTYIQLNHDNLSLYGAFALFNLLDAVSNKDIAPKGARKNKNTTL